MARWAKVKIGPDSVDNLGVGLRKLLQMRLPSQSPGHVLSEESNEFLSLLSRLSRRRRVVCRHDSQRESTRTTKGHVITAGGGMLGNIQQNSTKLILSIYFLSNVYIYCKNIQNI